MGKKAEDEQDKFGSLLDRQNRLAKFLIEQARVAGMLDTNNLRFHKGEPGYSWSRSSKNVTNTLNWNPFKRPD